MVKKIKLLALDIDGVLTDGRTRLGARRPEKKRLAFPDLDAINAAKRAGLTLALVTGESDGSVDLVAARTGVALVRRGAKDKLKVMTQLAQELRLSLAEICFVGDGNRDAPALARVGLAFAPANATFAAKGAAHRILPQSGGRGVVAEAVRLLLQYNENLAREKPLLRALRQKLAKHFSGNKSVGKGTLPGLACLASELARAATTGRKVLLSGRGAGEALAAFASSKFAAPAAELSPQPRLLRWQLQTLARPGDVVVALDKMTARNRLTAKKRGATVVNLPAFGHGLSTAWQAVVGTAAALK